MRILHACAIAFVLATPCGAAELAFRATVRPPSAGEYVETDALELTLAKQRIADAKRRIRTLRLHGAGPGNPR